MVKNEKNLEYLQKLQNNLGFGDQLNGVLESAISRELPKFSLGISNWHRPPENSDPKAQRTDYISFTLNYNKGKEDVYFLNSYDVSLFKNGEQLAPRKQTFDLERDHRITALQAFKLLSGMSLEKDIYVRPKGAAQDAPRSEKVKAWFMLQLDIMDANGNHPLKTLRPEYGFDLEKTLLKYPIKALETEAERDEAFKNLRNGNYVHTEITIDKITLPVAISANPLMKSVDIMTKDGTEIRDEDIWPDMKNEQKTSVVKSQPVPEVGQDLSTEQGESKNIKASRGGR